MNNLQNQSVGYKWDARTRSGYRLRYDRQRANRGLRRCFHVEDWDHHLMVNEWGCDTLDDALRVLGNLFDLDVREEREVLSNRF